MPMNNMKAGSPISLNAFLSFRFLGALLLVYACIVAYRRKLRYSRLPPSPPSDPIIGHARRFPETRLWLAFAEEGKTLGDVFHYDIFGRVIIVVNSLKACHELLDKRGVNTSGRLYACSFCDLVGLRPFLPFLPYGDEWKRKRQAFHQYFSAQSFMMFRPIQEQEIHQFLERLISSPENFLDSVKRLVLIISLKVSYGESVLSSSSQEDLLEKFERVADELTKLSNAGGNIVDLIPALRFVPAWFPTWFPGASVVRSALDSRALLREITDVPIEELKARRAEGRREACFVSGALDEYETAMPKNPEIEEEIKSLGFTTFATAYDTTASTLLSFFLTMCLNPDVMRRAQAEIDHVTKAERLPTLGDRPKLPYIDGIVKEVYRFHPPGPLGVPHVVTREERYGGWVFPQGSMVISNIWAMMKDENNFPSPEEFRPDRYLSDTNSGQMAQADPYNIVFGFGRRICPGRHFADATIWLAVANVLAVFDIKPYIDPLSNKEVPPNVSFSSGFASAPEPFKCSIIPRSNKHAQLISC